MQSGVREDRQGGTRRGLRTGSVLACTLSLVAGSAASQEQTLFDAQLASVAEIQAATKDAAAFAALTNLGERLALIPREVGDEPPGKEHIRAMWAIATGGGGLQVFVDPRADEEFSLSLTSTPSGGAEAVMPHLEEILDGGLTMRVERVDDATIQILDAPHPDASVRLQQVDDKTALVMRIGTDATASTVVRSHDLPEAASPIASGRFNVGLMLRIIEDETSRNEPQLADFLDQLGMFSAPDSSLSFALGTHDDALHGAVRISDAQPMFERYIGDTRLSPDHFRVVPRDATVIKAAVTRLDWLVPVIETVGEEFDRDLFAFLRDGFGIDLQNGVLENLGPRWIMYQAESTGGGGVMSAVFVCELRDTDAFLAAHGSALIHANQFGAALGRGYGRTREWGINGTTAYSLVAPGLPIPFEVSWAVAEDHLIVGATPTALIAALTQLDADSSVLDNAVFADSVAEHWPEAGAAGMSFRDTGRLAPRGYGFASLGASALANAARRPLDDFYDPGVLMPGYAEFVTDIRPTVSFTTVEGTDLLTRVTADGSALVQVAAASQQYGQLTALYVPGLAMGVTLPAIGQARQAAEAVRASAEVRAISLALFAYQADHDALPTSLDELIDDGYILPEQVYQRDTMPWDGGPSFAIRWQETVQEAAPAEMPPGNVILIVDRARYVNGFDEIPVGFADGSVRSFDRWSLDRELDADIYAELRSQLEEQFD